MKINYLTIILVLISFSTLAQSGRKTARSGNKNYDNGNFVDAEINYKKALEINSDLLEAQFNLGDALIKQERYDEALESFEKVNNGSENILMKANALHNMGNILLSQQDLEGAEESYKDALRLNPKDNETRYNYAFVKNLIQQQEENEENQDKNKEENQEENQDENNEENQEENQDKKNEENKEENQEEKQDESNNQEDKQDRNGDSVDKDQNNNEEEKNDDNKNENDGIESENEEKPSLEPKNKLSQEEAKKILEALNQQENKVHEKLKKHQLKGKKLKIEKDW